jgi:hypothetical protein
MARRLPRRAFCTARNDKFRIVIANVVWRSSGKEIASTTPQVWLVAGSHLGFAKKSFHSIASDKNRAVSVELVSRLPRRVFCTARNDKELESKNYDQVAGQWDCFSFSSFAMTRFVGKSRASRVR